MRLLGIDGITELNVGGYVVSEPTGFQPALYLEIKTKDARLVSVWSPNYTYDNSEDARRDLALCIGPESDCLNRGGFDTKAFEKIFDEYDLRHIELFEVDCVEDSGGG